MMEDPALASLSLTHISYDPNDTFSYLCAWLSLVPQGLIVAYVTLSWSSREAEILLCFIGQLACEALNFGLKRLIREERPNTRFRGKGYGMPSSHAQFMAFFGIYVTLFLLVRHRPSPSPVSTREPGENSSSSSSSSSSSRNALSTVDATFAGILKTLKPTPWTQQLLTSAGVLLTAALVGVSRVYLNYHTPKQVLVGLGVGGVFAAVWFAFTAALRGSGVLAWVLDLETVRSLRIRDLLTDEDLVDSGWSRFERKRAVSLGAGVEGEVEGDGKVQAQAEGKKGR